MIPCLTTARHNTLKYYDIVVCSNLQLFVVVCIYLKPDGIVRLFLLGVGGVDGYLLSIILVSLTGFCKVWDNNNKIPTITDEINL